MELQKVTPILPINYDRPIGQEWKDTIINGHTLGTSITLGQLFVYPEVLVPSSGDQEGFTALANTIYILAREHNMSLSAYGHLDPVKFIISILYLTLRMEEIRRNLSIIGKYQFGNRTQGDMFTLAVTGQDVSTNAASLLSNITKFNFLVARLNKMYLPTLELLNRWLPHRCFIFKDDAGDRYQYYLYTMANWYHLDVTSSSSTVGQLLNDFITRDTIANQLAAVETYLSQYEADDDFVNFAVEATKAGMPRAQIRPIDVTLGQFALPEFKDRFDIDDVLSLENAYYIAPIQTTHAAFLLSPVLTWDIKENTSTGKFVVGKCNTTENVLPVVHPLACYMTSTIAGIAAAPTGASDPLDKRPFFTHARITSEEGLSTWSRYIAAVSDPVSISGLISGSNNVFLSQLVQGSIASSVANTAVVGYLTVHSDMMLVRPTRYYYSLGITYNPDIRIGGQYIYDTQSYKIAMSGFKAPSYCYQVNAVTNMVYPIYHDFDYIVRLEKGNLDLFNASVIWNNFNLIGAASADGAKVNKSGKKFKPKK